MEEVTKFIKLAEPSSIDISLSLWVMFGLLMFIATINTVIFFYHWNRYHVGSALLSLQTLIIYSMLIGVPIFLMFTSLITYTL